ncbi:ATP-binding cassette domain-containing protein [Silvanigrella paludirubra]|uniref:ATP-binding cassette domain-containing protein n=1 Tax=Silvanigrella paludirubra TaxID=2499159 RepID=A0A6N6VT06_9BACT|nr:ATP-binding cassette domain-containing protein [Silvanigrella paludirubra]KAB8038686.1 ATP-binding cassette domain-containing protein [Silvanigrella paludirubra]
MQASSIVSLHEIHHSFLQNKPVLNELNLEIQKGESLTILGPGGSGKSTLLKVILGIIKPQSGSVHVLGKTINTLKNDERSKLFKKMGMAFQQGALFDFMTVRENILFAMENMTDFKKEEREAKVKSFLEQVLLSHAADKIPSELSGGMRRRVGFIRALVTNPELALLDEPTAGLDPVTTTIVIDMIHKIGNNIGTTMISVTSNIDVAFRFAPNVAILKDGKIIGKGTKEQLLELNDPWITNFLTIRKHNFEREI